MLVAVKHLLLTPQKQFQQQLQQQESQLPQQTAQKVQVAQMPTTSHISLCICGNAQPNGVEN